jgi:putative ABC transport system substrate-binding protein
MIKIFRTAIRSILSDNPKSNIQNPKWAGVVTLVIAFAMGCMSVQAQQPKKVFRIGYLSSTNRATDAPRSEGIRAALRERGYVEGQNIHIEFRHSDGKTEGYPVLVAELVGLKVDLILVAGGTRPIQAAKNATKTIPIVMTGTGLDPVKAGFVVSLARPGGNVTGLTTLNTELGGKRLELLKEAAVNVVRVAVLYNPTSAGAAREVKEDLPPAARALGLTLRTWEVRIVEDFDRVFTAINKDHPEGLYVPLSTSVLRSNVKRITDFALKSRLPSLYDETTAVDAGGLMSYAADVGESYRRVAYFVDRILKGTKPADLPVEQPMKFEFVINLKTANQIGITIPPDLLARATRIIR